MTEQSGFWLFLPRPDINSACNTILVNDVLSGVIVISNDNVRPYDVTTKDDLFYQVPLPFLPPIHDHASTSPVSFR